MFKYMFYAQKENSERKQKHHNEYKNGRNLPSVFLLCDCQKKSLEKSGTQLRTSRKGRYAPERLVSNHVNMTSIPLPGQDPQTAYQYGPELQLKRSLTYPKS